MRVESSSSFSESRLTRAGTEAVLGRGVLFTDEAPRLALITDHTLAFVLGGHLYPTVQRELA